MKTYVLLLIILMFAHVGLSQDGHSNINEEDVINIAPFINIEAYVLPLSFRVNSQFVERDPIVSSDGKTLFFSRQYHPKNVGGQSDPEDIWYSTFNEENQYWEEAKPMEEPLNNPGPNFVIEVGKSGDTLFLGNRYSKKGKMTVGASYSIKKPGVIWTLPTNININGEYNFSDKTGYDLSYGRDILISASKRDFGNGGRDLHVSFKEGESYTEPMNLGNIVNTHGDEGAPFLARDDKTLYYSTDGKNGYGGRDIFVTKRLDDTWKNWSEPMNLGPGINTPFNDDYFNFSSGSRYAYFSRGADENNQNIYRVSLTELFIDSLNLAFHNEQPPIEVGQTHIIENAFEISSEQILPSASQRLNNIALFLQKYKTVDILVITHAHEDIENNEGKIISNKRADKVANYLINTGVDEARIITKSHGNNISRNVKNPVIKEVIGTSIEIRFLDFQP